MTVGRRGPLSFLDTEWRTAVWRRWVTAHLLPEANGIAARQPVVPNTPSVDTGSAQDSAKTATSSASEGVSDAPANVDSARSVPPPAPLDAVRRGDRRSDVRARFDALSERLLGIEDALDVIARRLSHRTRRDHRSDRRTAELVESVAEGVEAQARLLDGFGALLERIERRLEKLERSGKDESERGDSRAPKARNSEPPRAPRNDDSGEFAAVRVDDEDSSDAFSGSAIRGSIGDMSLSTVLAMLEIERRSGRLKVLGEDGSIVAIELEDGSVVGSRVSENDVDAVESLREVLTWKNGRFWFRQNPRDSAVVPPRSVNSLLLEATRQIDEGRGTG